MVKEVLALLSILLFGIVVGGLLAALYFFEGVAPAGLLSVLGWLMVICGMVFFISLCGCLFVSEQTRNRRFGLCMAALGCFGVLNGLSEWLKPSEDFECGGGRLIGDLICFVIVNLPNDLQSPAWFLVLLLWFIGISILAKMGWRIYVDER